MKKFELGKVYEHISGGVVCAEFIPQFIGEDKAFGTWKSMHKVGDECETCVRHVCLEEVGLPKYREKPPEPQSLELFVNIYKGKDGKIFHGGSVHSSEENANKIATSYYNSTKRKHVGIAHVTFVEPKE